MDVVLPPWTLWNRMVIFPKTRRPETRVVLAITADREVSMEMAEIPVGIPAGMDGVAIMEIPNDSRG